MLETTTRFCLKHFCDVVIEVFEGLHLRSSMHAEVVRLLSASEKLGFTGILGGIDYSNWWWENVPTAFHGIYEGKKKTLTVIFKAIADQSVWIWHALFDMVGCLNEINVVEESPFSEEISSGE